VLHVGAFYGARAWPVDRFAAVARALADHGRPVVVSGGPADRGRAEEVTRLAGLPDDLDLAGQLDLADLAALIADAALLVSADTGAAHLASAYGTPSVVIFGPAAPEHWGPPLGGPHIALTDARVRRGEVFVEDPDPALLAVTADQVVASARDLLGNVVT
jgi:ADP-heptose:LPS heptosyltransferase